MKDENKMERKKEKKRWNKGVWIGAIVGGVYGIGPWIAGLFGSLRILIFFSFSNATILVFNEMLGLKNYRLSFGISIVLWTSIGALIGSLIGKIINKDNEHLN